ncbi:MAG: tRNA (adenosine(37)-N6)-threonylcarbamoyltransferase complex transferase subunit TsaD [Ruminococcaceae bacterium]|nr:tRNA (adenosine(37)-N6)-threonylcarbamoyltransferase complex transferase subunit TsaD [Oscillospiraceae bacterium]
MDILTLGIESSCDETSVAVVRNGREILSNVISSQIESHKEFGGVVPELASRMHVQNVIQVIDSSLCEAGCTLEDIDQIGVTFGPGLIGALLVGVSAAKALAYKLKVPLCPVHHLEGHISANFLQAPDLEPPFICLVASGGHSHIVECIDYGKFRILGQTRDDAAGEAFDKISRAIGLGYPGGPAIDKAAKNGDPNKISFPRVHFENSLDFSFSGVKTAVLNYINNTKEFKVEDVCASFQNALVSILTENLMKANEATGYNKIVIAGGVAANSALRASVTDAANKCGAKIYMPSPILCTDNGAMIASSAYYALKRGRQADLELNAVANISLESI